MVSLIIPVYNAADSLDRCLDSIMVQSYTDFQVWLINDGSTDNSGDICADYARRDARFVVLHQKNAGVSAARNAGLAHAKGDYIVFVDSDDWLAPDFLSVLCAELIGQQVDLVDQSFCRIYPDGSKQREGYSDTLYTQRNIPGWIDQMFRGHTGPFPKIYRREIIQAHNIKFDESLQLCEDLLFTLQYMQKAQNGMFFSKTQGYFYRQLPDSLGNSFYNKPMAVTFGPLVKILEVLTSSYYAPAYASRDELVNLRNKIIQLSMFFLSSLHNGSSRKQRLAALHTLSKYDLAAYWAYITIKNPLRKLFHWCFAHHMFLSAILVEDLRHYLDKRRSK